MSANRRMYVLSNMYPSENNIRYGIFVRRFMENFKSEFDIKPVVLSKKHGLLPKLLGYFKLYIQVVGVFFKSKGDDLIYVHFPLYFSYLMIPFLFAKRPLILNFHGNDALFDTTLKRILAQGLKWVAPKTDLVVVPSEYYQRRVMDLWDIPKHKICVYPSGGIDLSVFRPGKKKGKDFVFGYVSNFIREKGWEVFLEALSFLHAMDYQRGFKAIMVGDGPDKGEIQQRISQESFSVTLLDSVPQQELAKLYVEFDVFVFPTYRQAESLGLVGLEAMACGVPVLASMVGGPMGYVEPGYNGFLFEIKDSRSLARLMHKFMEMPSGDLANMRTNCIQTAKKYENTKVKRELLLALKSI